jgi:hypothetical protein
MTAKFLYFRQDLPRFEFIPGMICHLFLYPARFAKMLSYFRHDWLFEFTRQACQNLRLPGMICQFKFIPA